MPIEKITYRLFHTEFGNALISALFGVSVAFLFARVCKGDNCINIKAPEINEVKDKIFKIQDECYIYTPKMVSCNSSPSTQIIKNN